MIPAIAPSVRGRQFRLATNEKYSQYMKEHSEALKSLGLSRSQTDAALNYVNGKRSVARIADCVAADLDDEVPPKAVASYLKLLESVGWLVMERTASANSR
jgi:hypothetical protein